MDLRVYARVLWRFRLLVGLGLVLGLSVALLATVRVEFGGGAPSFAYRQGEVWESQTTLFVTQRGFPWGRAVFDEVVPLDQEGLQRELDEATEGSGSVPRFADPGRFQALAVLYARLAESDQVRALLERRGPIRGTYDAVPVPSDDGNGILPFVLIRTLSDSPSAAEELAAGASTAFRTYLDRQQAASRIQPEKRVEVVVVQRPERATLFQARSMVRPMFIFVLVIALTVGLAFILDNLRPRPRAVVAEPLSAAHDAARRTA